MRNAYGDPDNGRLVSDLKRELRRLRTEYADSTGRDFAD